MPKISCQGQILFFFLNSHLKKDDFAKKIGAENLDLLH